MKFFFKQNIAFIILYVLSMIVLGYILLNNGKVQIHEQINKLVGNPFFDLFFKYITHLGDGVFALLLIAVTLFINLKKSIYLLLSYSFASIVSGILKNYIFLQNCRPSFDFHHYSRLPLNFVDGVKLHTFMSFPSGHSTSAFAVFISLMFMTENKLIKALLLLTAFLTAFSRTYLSQHWLVDIYFGSTIGFSFALFFYFTFYKKNYLSKYESGILSFIKKQ